MKLIGLSVSLCIKDIIENKVNANDVEYISGSTTAKTTQEWKEVADLYCETYWRNSPSVGRHLLEGFLWQNKIRQPRLHGGQMPNVSMGHWIINRF